MTPEWLSVEQAGAKLGLTTRTVYRAINDGGLAAYRFGRVIRIQAQDVERYLEGARIRPGDLDHLTYQKARTTVDLRRIG